jgi:phage anti-repressor protein
MKLTKNNLIKKLGIKDNEVIELITTYNNILPILSEDGEGFCINARDLHKQLEVGREFAKWIKERIAKCDFRENEDFEVFVKIDEKGGRPSTEYNITMEMAKHLAMLQNNDNGKISRRYFIVIEKILKDAIKWELIRKPEKIKYKEMCEELKKYFQRNLNKEPMFYDYSNEADALNQICLGAKAKKIREYIDAQDKNTRDWLETKYNEYLDKLQDLNTMYLKMNFDKERRYDLIKQGFKALYPDASFLLICGDK